jgi:hypothetical protein
MVAPIKQESNDIEQHAKDLAEFFGAGSEFLKDVVERAKELVRRSFVGNLNKRLKDSGMFKVVTDAVGSVFKKPQQQPIVQTTLDKAATAPPKTNYTSMQPAESVNQAPLPFLANPNQPSKPVEKDYLQTEEKARIVLIGGLTKEGVDNLKEKLPEIFKEVFKNLPKTETQTPQQQTSYGQGGLLGMLPKGLLAMGGGLTLLLGGLAALVTGLQTDGPFKGLLKIFSKVGIEGGLKMLEKGAKTFLKTLTSFIKSPTKLLHTVYSTLKGVFGKGAAKGITKLIKPIAGLFAKLASGIVKMVTPLLKRLPLIGTIISWGFAYTRFKSGDTIGGIIDILSGVATLFPGVGTAISIGLDVLNAFLDYKTGGASPEASQKKAGTIGDFFGGIWGWIKDKAIKVFDWFINLGELIAEAKWGDVFMELAGWVPGLDWILGWFGTDTKQLVQKGNEMGGQYVDMITSFTDWIQTNIIDKITGFVGGVWDSVKSVASKIPFLGGDEEPELDKIELDKGRKSARGTKPKMAEGGVISTDMEALVGEDGDEAIVPLAKGGVVATQPTTTPIDNLNQSAVIPLEKYFNGKDFTLSNNTLEKIASNTGNTNNGLQALGQAIVQLARVLETNNKPANTIINSPSQQQYPSASQIAASNVDPIRAVRRAFAFSAS